jgi:hypothetical protein
MKVIAKIDNHRVLCEVSVEELAFLHGYRSQYDNGYKNANAMEVGSECNLKKMVATSQFVRSVRTKTLEETKDKLVMAINSIDEAIETVGSLEIFNILSEEKLIGDE